MIDVSNNNGTINWKALKGTQLVAAKCTEGTNFYDSQYAANKAGARSIGATFLPYHFGHPAVSAANQWRWFQDHAAMAAGDIPCLDLEMSDGETVADVAGWGSAWAHACYGAYRIWPWAYSDRAFIEAGNFDGLKMCPLWVADLSDTPPARPPAMPGFDVVADQYQWASGGDKDAVYLSAGELADEGIQSAEARRLSKVLAELNAADADLSAIRKLVRLLGGK
jgi:GH25 family lysozyme M1 (1,4-beta-N-acetylmuramidase)